MEDGVQKYQKVYNFLKRTLCQERYEGIRLIEPCVVVAQGFNKAFKYAVLGDEMLYVTENPPKASRDINMTIDLSTITSVGVIHDYPEFLNGDLKSKAQHIVIHYKNLTSKVGSSSSLKLALSGSVLGTSPVMSSESFLQGEKGGMHYGVHSPSPRRTSYLSVSGTLTEQVGCMRLSASESDIRTKLRQERSNLQSSSGDVSQRPLPVPPAAYRTSDYSDHKLQSNIKKSTSSKKKRHTSKQKYKGKNMEKNPELNSSSSSAELDYFNCTGVNATDSLVVQRPSSLSYSSDSLVNRRLSPPDMIRRPSSPCSIPNSKETQADLTIRHFRLPSTESNGSTQGSSDESADETDSANSNNSTEVHLYVLTEHSPMFMHLRSTWNNCVLKSTLHIGSSKSSLSSTASPTRIHYSKVDNSQLLQLFYQLKSEILQSQHMEKSFVLVQELLTAAQKSFVLKRFFWKSPDLFTFIVSQLQLYLPQSPTSSHARKRKLNRADELDFVVVLLEVLTCMFRETEVLMPRLNVLKSSKGQSVHELITTIVKTPKVKRGEESDGISHAAQRLLMAGHREQVHHSQRENEMLKLLEEIMDGACAVMHEVILAVHQAKCYASDDNVLNIYWLMKILESQETGLPFLERMMQRSMALVRYRSKLLSPKEAVLLFRQFYVLQNVLEYSESLAQFVRTAYAEEFRYYIKQHIVRKKLSSNYPVTGPLLRAVKRVSELVLSRANSKSFMR